MEKLNGDMQAAKRERELEICKQQSEIVMAPLCQYMAM